MHCYCNRPWTKIQFREILPPSSWGQRCYFNKISISGSPHFKEFYQDKEVVNKFVKVAMDGLQKAEANEGVKLCEEEKDSGNYSPLKGILS